MLQIPGKSYFLENLNLGHPFCLLGHILFYWPDYLMCYSAERTDVIITQLADIEENVWSPRFGIKGKIDLTVEVKVSQSKFVFYINII